MRLLPPELDRPLGFTPYVWLVYLLPFVAEPFWRGRPASETALVLAATGAFLVLYFAGYWREGTRLLPIVGAIALLGVLFTLFGVYRPPINGAAMTFFIYAAGHAARTGPPRFAMGVIGAIVAVIGVEAWALALAAAFWGTASVLTLLIGGVNVHFAEAHRKDEHLRLAREEVERLAKIAERERIARDLHDLLGHTLSVIVLKSDLAAKLAGREPAAALREIRDVERISREALGEIRAAVSGYRSSVAGELARARQALRAAGVSFEPRVEPLSLPQAQEGVLALAIREAVTNVVRHSGARSCRLSLGLEKDLVRLVIEDDGRGGLASEGVGLASMRERLAGLGGTLERSGENGTRLLVSVPLLGAP